MNLGDWKIYIAPFILEEMKDFNWNFIFASVYIIEFGWLKKIILLLLIWKKWRILIGISYLPLFILWIWVIEKNYL